jgi:SAM-dependent methyltransferase
VFSNKVRDYVAYRPGYPQALSEFLRSRVPAGAQVADVGAGTGLLTRDLLAAGYEVTAVEPNDEMRADCDALLGSQPGYRSASGTAEALPCADHSLHLITAAQAFHWFDIAKARAECLRVLRPGGVVALIWNDRVAHDPLSDAMDNIARDFGGSKRQAMQANDEKAGVAAFFSPQPFETHIWPYAQRLTIDGMVGLLFSRSYMPARDSDEGVRAEHAIRKAVEPLAVHDELTMRYETVCMVGAL